MNNPLFLEVNVQTLHANTMSHFPTRSTNSLDLTLHELRFIYTYNKSLIVRARVEGIEQDNYITIMYFRGVEESENPSDGIEIPIKGREIYINPVTITNNCKVRCQCKDFDWTFKFYNKRDDSLYGREKEIVPLAGTGVKRNPSKTSGLCKHLMATYRELIDMGIIQS